MRMRIRKFWRRWRRRSLRAEQVSTGQVSTGQVSTGRLSAPGAGEPRHVHATLSLRPAEAVPGTTKTVTFTTRSLCAHCDGAGSGADGASCAECRGNGLGRTVEQSVKIRIPAGCGDGTIIRVAGRGIPGAGVWPAGDLRLRVRLVDPSREPSADAADSLAVSSGGQTITSQRVAVTVDRAGLLIRRNRKTAAGSAWETHLQLPWAMVTSIAFENDRYDPVIALYVYTTAGDRQYVMDSSHLSQPEWARLADVIAKATDQRVLLDLTGRQHPPFIHPDV
jgi:DnaJ-class molecular chaperone